MLALWGNHSGFRYYFIALIEYSYFLGEVVVTVSNLKAVCRICFEFILFVVMEEVGISIVYDLVQADPTGNDQTIDSN